MKTNSIHTLAIVYASVCSPGAFVKHKIPQPFGALGKHAGYTKLRDQLQALQILVSQFPLLLPTYHLT